MKDKIKSIIPILDQNGHKYYKHKSSNQVIYLFDVTFETNAAGEFGSIEKVPKFKVGDFVDVNVIKSEPNRKPYYSLKEFKEGTFPTSPTPLAPNNTIVGIEATKLAISIMERTTNKLDFANDDFNETVKKLSRKIAKIMNEVIISIDLPK